MRLVPFFLVLAIVHPVYAQVPDVRIDLNIPSQELVVLEEGVAVKRYPVSVGTPDYPTPRGDFYITHAEWNPWWHPPQGREWTRNKRATPPGPGNPMGRVKLFFAPLYFIHGTTEEALIGSPASHGCIRMRNKDVIELGKYLHSLMTPAVSPQRIDSILRIPSNTRRINMRGGVPFSIRYDRLEVVGEHLVYYPDVYDIKNVHEEDVWQELLRVGPASRWNPLRIKEIFGELRVKNAKEAIDLSNFTAVSYEEK